MIPALVVFAYLAVVLYIGIFAFRRRQDTREDFFLASRSLGPYVFLLTVFGTNMTAFSILGSSGLAYQRGIGVYGLMASSSALVIPLTLLWIGTRLWAVGRRHGHMTQVQYFRDRWECSGIGTVIFGLTAAMMLPYLVIGVMGGGETLATLSGGAIPQWVGGMVVAGVVMTYVFFGGMRGVAWVNAFQTTLFLLFGTIAFVLITRQLGGLDRLMTGLGADPATAPLLTRERMTPEEFLSYTFIPLSSIMFPHMAIMCMTAREVTSFKKTVVFYPVCLLLIWLPSVVLGVVAAGQFPGLRPGESDQVLLRLLTENTPVLVSGLLGAAIMACVMATDSQIMALCTMFTEDVFAHHGGRRRFGERAEIWMGRAFAVVFTVLAYALALALANRKAIFDLAVRFGFTGFAALTPLMVAALFWRRSTKWGALAVTLWVVAGMAGLWALHEWTHPLAPRPGSPPVPVFPALGGLFLRTPSGITLYGYMPVVFLCLGSVFWMVVGSLLTRPPADATLQRYFGSGPQPERKPNAGPGPQVAGA